MVQVVLESVDVNALIHIVSQRILVLDYSVAEKNASWSGAVWHACWWWPQPSACQHCLHLDHVLACYDPPCLDHVSSYLCELGAYAKFQNPWTIPEKR